MLYKVPVPVPKLEIGHRLLRPSQLKYSKDDTWCAARVERVAAVLQTYYSQLETEEG